MQEAKKVPDCVNFGAVLSQKDQLKVFLHQLWAGAEDGEEA